MRRFVIVPHEGRLLRVALTDHVLDQYIERLRPCAGRDQAHAELEALAPTGELLNMPPAWAGLRATSPTTWFLVFLDAYALIVLAGDTGPFAVTFVVRGALHPLEREARRRRRQARRRRVHARTHMEPGQRQAFRRERRDQLERESDERRDRR